MSYVIYMYSTLLHNMELARALDSVCRFQVDNPDSTISSRPSTESKHVILLSSSTNQASVRLPYPLLAQRQPSVERVTGLASTVLSSSFGCQLSKSYLLASTLPLFMVCLLISMGLGFFLFQLSFYSPSARDISPSFRNNLSSNRPFLFF